MSTKIKQPKLTPAIPKTVPKSVFDVIYAECEGFVECGADPQTIWDACRAAILAQTGGGGYKLVPIEPTEDMIAAAMNCDDVTFNVDESFCVNFGNIYAAMLAAVPEDK
ncbi:hypothetical protein OI978_13055 [Serratia nevei]|uniref:hypothetical protein n=1 Tax=Serratia TaxID=613 RepID=UPI001A2F0B45|nr:MULTISPECIES: hypothetical protein [Serratia]WIJ66810.1 hypothetical protein OI978_13055 [Serratia nevei]CAI1743173.1 Uncharacterised protein [Serratia marcescens]CAI1815956.1 Uncharacterised protein [Serratia marcescens]CAI1908445.1 Uncharacterised protein [Serratia marcescens]CAI1927491.1 Uncharacterised protein [Serratia marcescens]